MTNKNFLAGTWDDFESWIKEKVGGDIYWKIRPRDTKVNRMEVAQSIFETMKRNGGTFPSSGNVYVEVAKDERHS